MSLKRKFLPVWTFAKLDVKRLFRDKVGIFFVFVFPLIFLIVFGFIFGRDDGSVSFNVALINQSQTEPAKQFEDQIRKSEIIKVKDASSEQDALQKMKRGELDSVIVLPSDFGAVKKGQQTPSGQAIVRYDQNKSQAGTTLTSVLQEGVFKPINQRLAPSSDPFTAVARSTSTEGLRQFDFTFAGLLGFTLLTSGIFGPTSVFPRLKQRGVLRRYSTTTLKVWQYFTANVLSNGVVALMSLAVMFIVAQLMFGVTMRGDYLTLAAFATLGATLMFGIGLSIGGWAKNENQAAPLGQIVSFPMMFLSGIFFPTFLMPGWLQNITQFIPLTPVVDGIRLILTEGYTLMQLGPQLLIMGVWLIVVYLIAFKVFRWE